MQANMQDTARLHYRSSPHLTDPDHVIDFPSLEDAVAFAMTQNPGNRELAWADTASGRKLRPSEIAALWELRRE
ncbi:hypothetical protein IMF23_05320 [Chelatococcus daeguensis]|nr:MULTISPECIES: hypothetical protein [Chelatococcus]MBM3082857.1 hypothetical protein [Chelatococcus daeguensis]CUA89683.1 hypothetical protein Ga0061061_10996 [Chelatococcus sambhunathii]